MFTPFSRSVSMPEAAVPGRAVKGAIDIFTSLMNRNQKSAVDKFVISRLCKSGAELAGHNYSNTNSHRHNTVTSLPSQNFKTADEFRATGHSGHFCE